jgi:uncharacterized protein YndB with AHSA1/START domain
MNEVRVLVHFAAPIDRVFDAVSDHESFLRGPGTTTRLSREGTPERNGVGCERDVRAPGGMRFLEEVTAWERPSRYEYVIRKSPMPMKHEKGWLQLTPRGSGTDVEWTTRFEVPIPVVGNVLAKATEGLLRTVFKRFLTEARARVEGERG